MHLADITPSIFAGLGLASAEDVLHFGESPNGRECLFLIDGLGRSALEEYAEFAPLLSSLFDVGSVATAFPSTTVTSLTSLMTGTLPGAHGMLGYTVRVPRSGGRILNSLKWDERVDPLSWQPVPTLFQRAAAAGIHVSHVAAKRYEGTGFTAAAFRGARYRGANVMKEIVSQAALSLEKAPSFTYVYVNEVDVAGHSHGVGSERWLAALGYADHVAQALLESLPQGTRLWITADHGMVNATEKIILGQENALLEGISLVAGEPRARHLYLVDDLDNADARSEVADRYREFFNGRIDVFTKEEAIEGGLFGRVVTEPAYDRMGDVIAIPSEGLVLIDPLRAAIEIAMVGHHGSMTPAECQVPLRRAVID